MASTHLHERPTTPTSNAIPSYDLVCIGFGPAQLATAIALHEEKTSSNVLFLERESDFSWQNSSMTSARMNTPFSNDLVTPRNPKSHFTYINYLLSKGRLVEFANSDRLQPLRIEFEEYLRWCAAQFKDQVRYRNEVVAIAPERTSQGIRGWDVAIKSATGQTYVVKAMNILAPAPKFSSAIKRPQPQLLTIDFDAGQRVLSFEQYLERRSEIREPRESRLDITLVGDCQRTLELLDDLLSCHRLGNITVVTENEALAPVQSLNDSKSQPNARLCDIWKRPSTEPKNSVHDASELVQQIYSRAYDKRLQTKGQYALRVQNSSAPLPRASFVITEQSQLSRSNSNLFHDIDELVLGVRQCGESLSVVQFKRNTVNDACRIWLIDAKSEGGSSLARDLAVGAGEVVKALDARSDGRHEQMVVNARM